jgi:hypothetical protein
MTRSTHSAVLAVLCTAVFACSQSNDFNLPPGTAPGAGGAGGSAGAGGGSGASASAGSAPTGGGGSAGSAVTGAGGASGSGETAGQAGGTSVVPPGTGGSDATGVGGAAGVNGAPARDAGGGGTSAAVDAGARVTDAAAPAEGGLPAGAVVLFDGKNFDGWQLLTTGAAAPWILVPANKAMEVVPYSGDIISKAKFEDVFLHIEYMTPKLPPQADIQARGNSGIYLKMAYEMQVLETHDLAAADDQCGAVYKVKAPLTVACFDQLLWNTYEIEFKAPRFNASNVKTANARFTRVTLNGVLVQNDTEVPGTTYAGQPEAPGPQPILLQDHHYSNTVQFRNIWAVPR